jgi:hypothetical protein
VGLGVFEGIARADSQEATFDASIRATYCS